MTLRHELVGVPTDAVSKEWTDRDTLLYALAVGAGSAEPASELAYTTENTAGVAQRVIPTFGCVVAGSRSPRTLGDYDAAKLIHAEQSVVFHEPLAPAGVATSRTTLRAIYDKGKSAMLVQDSEAVDVATGRPLVTSTGTFMVFGEGGFGGERGPSAAEWDVPARDADHTVRYATRRDQPLLYRLTGDRNPLHSDPAVAARAGLPRPIMHGMCTYGFSCRALLAVADAETASLASMTARFTKPALPGDDLVVQVWVDSDGLRFRTLNGQGDVVLDRGFATLR